MIRVYEAANLQDAHILLGLLTQARIPARILNAHAQGGLGDIPFGETYPGVWIEDERDLPRARQLVADYQSQPVAAGTQTCVACGEESPANFHTCWNCGASLSA
jgi:hypothetical protein